MKLRGHHLVCLHFFSGEGYSEIFIDNLKSFMRGVLQGRPVEVVKGPDDVCRACPSLAGEKCEHKVGADEEIDEMDQAVLARLGVQVGDIVMWKNIKNKVDSFGDEWFDKFCRGCDWKDVCEKKKGGP